MNIYTPPHLTRAAIALVKHFEGCFLEAYRDPVGVLTIGYGHTAGVKSADSVTQQQAEDLLLEDLDIAQADVRHHVKIPLNDNQFGALVSLAFNIGGSAFAHSTLVRKLNKGECVAAAEEFGRFVKGHIHGRRIKLEGLVLRRQAEREMFEAPLGSLVRNGEMVLAGLTIPVPGYGPRPKPRQPADRIAVAGATPPAASAQTVAQAAPTKRTAKIAKHASLASVAAGSAAGALAASDTPAAHNLVQTVSAVWQQAGGTDFSGNHTAWIRWLEAFHAGANTFVHGGDMAPLMSYLTEFIRSHEGVAVFLVTVALVVLRAAGLNMFANRSREV